MKSVKFRALLLIMALALSSQPIGAQYNPTPQSNPHQSQRREPTRPWGQTPIRKGSPQEFTAVRLDRDVVLPNLPGYTGKQIFVNGLQYPSAVGGAGYMVVYNTEHTQAQVKEWWVNALRNDPWKIQIQTGNTVKAFAKDGSKCTITASPRSASTPEKMKGMNGSYTIYFQARSDK